MAEELFYDVDADNEFKKAMLEAAKRGLDLSFSMGESVRIIKKESTKNFILKGSGKYQPLNPAYMRRKQILAPGTPILTGTKPGSVQGGKKVSGGGQAGKLKNSIIGNTQDSIVRIGKDSLEFGTEARSKDGAPYPKHVQEGTKHMSPRLFLFFSKAMVKQIVNTINADVGNQL